MNPGKARSAIISVGDELLAGRVTDTNASWLSSVLRREGFPVALRLTVPDDVLAIAAAVRQAVAAAPVVVVGGGIGPTRDDVTRDGVAAGVGARLVPHPAALELVRASYVKRGLRVPAGSDVQALLPEGAEPIANRVGTAPGILVRGLPDGAVLAAVPGVPGELRAMVEDAIVPLLAAHPARGPTPALASLTIAGMREVDVGRAIEDLMERGRDPAVGSYPKLGRVVLTIESFAAGAEGARKVAGVADEIRRRLGPAVAADGDVPLNRIVAELLTASGTTVAVAESLTGGLVADGLVEIPGISAVFLAGWVTYADRAKTELLGVPEALIAESGAVSEECARAMAEGARRRSGAALGVALTGIAGPGGGSEKKPVGTVWFAVADAAGCDAERVVFPGDRAAVRAFARERAFDLMRRRLLGIPLRVPPVRR